MCIKDNYNEICYNTTDLQKIYDFMDDCENNCIKFGSCDYNGMLNDKCVDLEAIQDDLTCPHCNYSSEYCNFPDLFYSGGGECKNQYALLMEMQQKGFNIVTCGMCGEVLIHKTESI